MTLDQDETLLRAYTESKRALRLKDARVGYAVAGILVPLGVVLDYMVYPDLLLELFGIRIACSVTLALLYLVAIQKRSSSLSRIVELGWSIIISGAIALMIYLTEGVHSPYYAGLNLVILGMSLMLPLTAYEAIVVCGSTILLYVIATIPTLGADNIDVAFNNLFFLTLTSVISCVTSHFSEKQRFVEFRLRWELDVQNKKLAELDRMKSDFYANISHELRTPLTLILAPVEDLLADNVVVDPVRRKLSYVKENTYRLLKLVNDLLDVLRLEERKDLLERQPVELNSILGNIVAGMEPLAERKVIDLSYQASIGSASILGDTSAVEKIFINLINNALKFTETGGSVKVSVEQNNSQVFVVVSDTGVGIASEDLPYIFDRFRQVDSSATRKHQGTGLGLALVKELSELQEGVVEVQSKVGQGTTMTVKFPNITASARNQIEEQPELEQVSDVHADDGLDTLHRAASYSMAESQSLSEDLEQGGLELDEEYIGAKLLIVEDEPDVRHYLAESLSPYYDLDLAVDGAEGLYKIQTNKPDLVVLDLMLPKMDGLAVCAAAKSDPETATSKIMLLTARTDERSKMTALEHGADDFLTKPFSTTEIKTRLRNLWKNSDLQRELIVKNRDLGFALDTVKQAQGQLVQSEKLNAIGRLAAGLLHEVNNPLNFALANFQLLEREDAITQDESLVETMADIRVGLERIANIVKDLKTFAYPEKTDVEKVFKLRSAADSAVRLTSTKTINTEVTVDIDENLELKGSQSHIVQIFVNLIENAVDAMAKQGTTDQSIRIFVTDVPGNADRCCVHVKDNGPGISAEKIELIFDPFFTTKDVGEGMGMGLSICYTIVKNHGGELKAESEMGVYTDFQFDLKKDVVISDHSNQENREIDRA